MVGYDQCPRRERHELPGEQEDEGIVGDDHQIHRREKRRDKRQHALRRRFMPAVADRVEAGNGPAQIDDDEEESGQRIEA